MRTRSAPTLGVGRTADGRGGVPLKEAAKIIGVSYTTARLLASSGKLPTYRVDSGTGARAHLRVPVEALERYRAGEVV